jgi:hypothetical protein
VSSFCLGCGNSLADGERFCGACGRDSQAGPGVVPVDPQVAFGLPPETSGKAIFSLICGILFVILPLSIVAVIFGYIALSEIRKSPGRLKGRGLAITGIVLGYLGVACIVGFFGLGFYEVRKTEQEFNEQKNAGIVLPETNRNSVVSSIRSLNMAEIAYSQAHRDAGYTCSLPDLSGVWGICDELATGRKSGYIFKLTNCSAAKPGGPVATYHLLAYSAEAGRAGTPAYCSDQSDVIRVLKDGSPQDCFKTGVELSVKEMN